MSQQPSIISSLKFNAGTPPPEWIKATDDMEHRARMLSLWEMTIGLIKDEPLLSDDQTRFLAMIADHKVSI